MIKIIDDGMVSTYGAGHTHDSQQRRKDMKRGMMVMAVVAAVFVANAAFAGAVFDKKCAMCHGEGKKYPPKHSDKCAQTVKEGTKTAAGTMPKLTLTDAEITEACADFNAKAH